MFISIGTEMKANPISNAVLLNSFLSDGNTVANYQAGVGLTGTTNASAWANQIGAAGSILQATGAAQPAIQADGSLLFDGVNHWMKAAAFTFVQPYDVHIVFKLIAWVVNKSVHDGETANTLNLFTSPTTPSYTMYAGASGPTTAALAVAAQGVMTSHWDGASSALDLNGVEVATGNPGAGNAGGYTLGSNPTGGGKINAQYWEIILRKPTTAADRHYIDQLLMAKYGIT